MISNFDLKKLNSLLKDFHAITNIRITIFDENFQELTSYPHTPGEICQIIRASHQGLEECKKCDNYACEVASKRRASYTYTCHAGLTESITPVIVGNIVIGYLLFGHVFSYSDKDKGCSEILSKCASYPLEASNLKNACMKQNYISSEYIESASHIMQAVASFLCMERIVSLHQQSLPVQIDEYINAHFMEDISTLSIAEYFKIGKTQLCKLCNENYGIGPATYIRQLRIHTAKKMLQDRPELSLSEIAFTCGFIDYNHFSTTFKKITGNSPKYYRSEK